MQINGMNKTRVHIIKRDEGWAVKKEGGQKASRVYESKEEAKQNSRSYREKGHDVIVHKRDGTIEKWEKAKK
jgi:hypothetical protein